jgi:LAO/AO transport system kinase
LKPKDSALSIQPGVESTAAPADTPTKRRRRPRLSREEYVNGVLLGDRTVLAQAITLIESLRPEDSPLAQEILEACLPHTGNSIRVGITGVPGVGKSTFIEALGAHLTNERGEKTAVLAVDPSSQVSGGSILGDKTRMEGLANNPLAFIRPSPSGGSLGGVARRTRETLLLCEAAGYQNVLVETVGVGQSETMVRAMVDFFLLLMLPGAGDELQGMKRGIMELTDLIAINKADGNDRTKAQVARREYESALHLLPASPTGWSPRVVTCSAQAREGISEVWTIVLEHNLWLRQHGLLEAVRREQVRRWMDEMIRAELLRRFRSDSLVRERLPHIEREVVEGRLSSFRAVEQLLDSYYKAK